MSDRERESKTAWEDKTLCNYNFIVILRTRMRKQKIKQLKNWKCERDGLGRVVEVGGESRKKTTRYNTTKRRYIFFCKFLDWHKRKRCFFLFFFLFHVKRRKDISRNTIFRKVLSEWYTPTPPPTHSKKKSSNSIKPKTKNEKKVKFY